MTFSDVFLYFSGPGKWERPYTRSVYCGFVTSGSPHLPVPDWLRPRLGERASEIDIARILSSAEVSFYFSFRYLVFVFVPTCHHKVHKARSNDCCGRGSRHAASDTVRA